MDRLSQLRGGAGGSRDASLEGSGPGDSFLTANETPSKYFSLSEDDSFDIAKDVSLATATSQNTLTEDCLMSNLSPIGKKDMLDYKIGKQIEAANILSGGVDIFEDNDNSYDGNELVIDDNVETDDKSLSLKSPESSDLPFHKGDGELTESALIEDMGGSKETEVVLQIDGKNVDAINIGNGLYLYRKEGQEELAAVQIIDDDQQQPSFKFLKVRENAEGNLEVYEEIEIEVPKEVPVKEGKPAARNPLHVPIKDINKVISDPGSSKIVEKKIKTPDKEVPLVTPKELNIESSKDVQAESKTELNLNGKMVKYSESRKSPLMAYHSTPIKEGIPLTKTMVDQQLQPSRHSDNVKKTIEVHTDSCKQRILEMPNMSKEAASPEKRLDEAIESDKPHTKDVTEEKETGEVAKNDISDSVQKKDNEVTDVSNAKKDEAIEHQELDAVKDEVKAKDVKGELPTNSKEGIKEYESSSTKPGNLDKSSDTTTISEINEIQNIQRDEKETAIEDVVIDSSHQLSENKGSKVNEIIITETIDSEDMVVCEKALVIEEVSKSQSEVFELKNHKNKNLEPSAEVNATVVEENVNVQEKEETDKPKEVILSTEVKTAVADDQTKIQKFNENDKPESLMPSVDVKVKVVEDQLKCQALDKDENFKNASQPSEVKAAVEEKTNILEVKEKETNNPVLFIKKKEIAIKNPQISYPSGKETKVTNSSDCGKNTETLKSTETKSDNIRKVETVVMDTDLIPLEDAIKEINKTAKSDNIRKVETVVMNTDIIPLEDAIKEINKTDFVETHEKNVPKEKSVGMEPSVSKIEIKRSVNSFDYNLVKKPKLENKPEVSSKKEALTVNHSKVTEATTLPKKEQSQSILPKNTQNPAKINLASAKSDVNPTVVKVAETKTEISHKSESSKQSTIDAKPKLINNNHAPVPFGKWTEANRQDFLNKIKESKVPVNSSNANQLKQPNDLNRRDVLKKIDSQRQTYNANVKIQESLQKGSVKTESAFASKSVPKRESKVPLKEAPIVKPKPTLIKNPVQETVQKDPEPSAAVTNTTKQEPKRKEIHNQDLIDKTIEGIINKAVTGKSSEDMKQTETEKPLTEKSDKKSDQSANEQPSLLDAIEIKMNELHGIPFVERPVHELPRPYVADLKVSPKSEIQPGPQKLSKIPNLLPLTKSQQKLRDCEDEIMKLEFSQENNLVKSAETSKVASKQIEKLPSEPVPKLEAGGNSTKKDTIITEKEFDKFARRNSVTYENCLTVTDAHQVIQAVVPKEVPPKKISRNEQMLAEAKAKSPHKHQMVRQYPSKSSNKYASSDAHSKQYQSKLQMAYQTALTAKRHLDSPITIIEDKPVKVVYLESSGEFPAGQLNVQGRDLSPARRAPEPDALTVGTCDSLDSDILDAIEDVKYQDETKTKSKHQRKQVLTPVETPELELIEPGDLGIHVSPKKKRKTDDKPEKNLKNVVPKKSYLLGRSAPRAETGDPQAKISPVEATAQLSPVVPPVHKDAVSAIDNLVKAAELLENQSGSVSASPSVQNSDSPQNTPVKRGRGRPRKYPVPEGSPNTSAAKAPSPQKKARLIDAKAERSSSDDDTSDEDALIKENWTMGKINENIVCPICSKLFRSENVVFKHVKHCTGPSPSRSDSGKRSPRRSRLSRESEGRPRASRHDHLSPARTTHRKRKSKDSKSTSSNDDVIQVESNPKISEKNEEPKKEPRKSTKSKLISRTSNLVCEICGKSFRQLSYLISHKLQHKKDESKLKKPIESHSTDKNVFSCETCQKEFRKLHHLVQHRLIHNPVPVRALRKTSSEQKELLKTQDASKVDDQSAAFRCEPCDKSFRKLHHLVEHRETHDGINRQRSNSVTQVNPEKPTPPPQCDICKKTFRKLHLLIEHKEQHLETSSEKSDDQKSVKSSLSTKDIIHECNLCYMVFPNEHSLTKHTVICLRKKKQSAAKQAAAQEDKSGEDSANSNASKPEESQNEIIDEPQQMDTDSVEEEVKSLQDIPVVPPTKSEVPQTKDDPPKNEKVQTIDKSEEPISEPIVIPEEKAAPVTKNPIPKVANKTVDVPPKIKQTDEIIVIEDTPVKKRAVKEKVAPTVTKRQKSMVPPVVEERTSAVTSSDDDEVRYMFNPDFKIDESAEGKNFMKVRAKKRSSLQIERPNSRDLVRRKSLLQHPPKIPRLRAKSDDTKIALNQLPKQAVKPKLEKVEQVPSDSDDSDVKYSFPKTVPVKTAQTVKKEPAADTEKIRRKTMAEKRKSLSGIAKRKSLGKAIVKAKPSPAKPVKRRTLAAEHRCDCGQLFSSAALLARHASLAHTPPRLRRERDPPAPSTTKTTKPTPRTSVKNETVQKSSAKSDARKSVSETVKKTAKSRNRAHGGVPLPEKRPLRK